MELRIPLLELNNTTHTTLLLHCTALPLFFLCLCIVPCQEKWVAAARMDGWKIEIERKSARAHAPQPGEGIFIMPLECLIFARHGNGRVVAHFFLYFCFGRFSLQSIRSKRHQPSGNTHSECVREAIERLHGMIARNTFNITCYIVGKWNMQQPTSDALHASTCACLS